jgi:hypothetical protein
MTWPRHNGPDPWRWHRSLDATAARPAPGQQVRILYDAFPYQKFGTYRGSVTKVSQTILTSNDATGPITVRIRRRPQPDLIIRAASA